jgi:hypothetical protein
MNTREKCASLARITLVVLCGLVLLAAPLGVRADEVAPTGDTGGDDLAWSWTKFFDYGSCAAGIVATVGTGGVVWAPTMLICARAVALHMSD